MSELRYATDTSPEAYAVQLALLRRMTPMERLRKSCAWSRQVKRMSLDAIRRRHPDLDENGVRLKFIEIAYGRTLAGEVKRWQEQLTIG